VCSSSRTKSASKAAARSARSDSELVDLQKKAAEIGGNVALMTPHRKAKGGYFGLQEYMTADVYRCEL